MSIGNIRTVSAFVLALSLLTFFTGCGNTKQDLKPASETVNLPDAEMVGVDVCTSCHSIQTAEWLASKHANVEPLGDLNSKGTPSYDGFAGSTCAACHDQLGDGKKLAKNWTGNVDRPVVGCESCHGGGSLHYGQGPIGYASVSSSGTGTSVRSAQLNTCTSCHELLNSSGTGTAVASHSTDTNNRIITDTHFATPGDFSGSVNIKDITGYVMDFSDENVCANCHKPHAADNTVNLQWAQSKHGNKTAAGAWAHYNWSSSSRAACQRCHTLAGFIAFTEAMKSGTTYSSPIAVTTQFKPDLLSCTGCHTDNKGSIRNPGAYTADYGLTTPLTVVLHTYPDMSSSNVCMPCHTGRKSGGSVGNLVSGTTSSIQFSTVYPHFLPAGGTVDAATGYHFNGRSYSNSGFKHNLIGTSSAPNTGSGGPCVSCHMSFSSQKHLFSTVTKSADGSITDVTAKSLCEKCHPAEANWLGGKKVLYHEALLALMNQLDKNGFAIYADSRPYYFQVRTGTTTTGLVTVSKGSITVYGDVTSWITDSVTIGDRLRDGLSQDAYKITNIVDNTTLAIDPPYSGASITNAPYIIIKKDTVTANGVKDWTKGGTDGDGKNYLGAAFNLFLLDHEPGAFAHNSYYVKRLIYDSIDWLDNGSLDNSVGTTLSALPAETEFKEGAMSYLLPYGVRNGDPLERP